MGVQIVAISVTEKANITFVSTSMLTKTVSEGKQIYLEIIELLDK